MMRLSDLPGDLVGEIFSRVPLTSLSVVRSTCKTWNDLSKNHTLGQKARKNLFLEFMWMHGRVYSLRFDLQRIRNDEEEEDEYLVDSSLKLLDIPNIPNNQDNIFPLSHCNGLLLCVMEEDMLVVWNPYLGQTRLIQPRRSKFGTASDYALGFDNNCKFKILRVFNENNESNEHGPVLFDIYDFSSNSWRSLDVNSEWERPWYFNTVSLKGNSYFFSFFCEQEVATVDEEEVKDYLRCFDFTTERFGPRLSMPMQIYPDWDSWIISRVRDEKLVVAYSNDCAGMITKIWITTKIEPNAVSWSKFLTLDMRLINGKPAADFRIHYKARSFFIDEEKKIAVFLDSEICKWDSRYDDEWESRPRYQMAYIYGENGYFKSVNMGEIPYDWCDGQLTSSSYVKFSATTNQPRGRKERENQTTNQPTRRNHQN